MLAIGKKLKLRSKWMPLREGSEGPEVAALQVRLAKLGYDAGEPDGKFGPVTKDALLEFQREHGLYPDGIAGPQVFKLLDSGNAYPRILHIVDDRETPEEIAGHYGVPPELLLRANHLKGGEFLRKGQRVVIPTRIVAGYLSAELLFEPAAAGGEGNSADKHLFLQAMRMTMLVTFGHRIGPGGEIDGPIPLNTARQHRAIDRLKPGTLLGIEVEENPMDIGEGVGASIVESLLSIVLQQGLLGVHLYPSRQLLGTYEFLDFARMLKRNLKERGKLLTIEVRLAEEGPEGCSPTRPYRKLMELTDWVIARGSDMTMPVDSLRRCLKALLKDVPPWKVIMAIPLSSWDRAPDGSPQMITYARACDLVALYKPLIEWDETLGLSRFKYRSFGEIHEVLFEDAKSFAGKLQIAENARVSGIALWWLGVGDPEIFKVMKQRFLIWRS